MYVVQPAMAISDCYDVMLYVNVGKLLHSENEKRSVTT